MTKPIPGAALAPFVLPSAGNQDVLTIGGPKERWSMIFVYRGKHCPRCKKFLNKLNAMLPAWKEVLDVTVISADPADRAAADLAEFGWDFDLGYGLTEPQMRAMGLYVTDPLTDAETTWRFAEPGAFGLRPDGSLILVNISNGPAARPDLEELLDGMIFNIKNDRPTRGLA